MKVISIANPEHNDELDFAESLLSRSMFNDKLFDRIYFKIIVALDDPSDYLYRILWESVYLNRSSLSRYDEAHHRAIICPSLSEVIGYIYSATPPRLTHLIPESIKSISEINNSLTQFLMDDNGGHLITYLSYFKKYMRLGEFETKLTYNKNRLDVLVTQLKDNSTTVIADVESSPFSINELMVYDKEKTGGCIQITLCYKNTTDTVPVCEMMSNNLNGSKWEITNVCRDQDGMYITLFTTNYDGNLPQFIREILQNQIK